MAHVAPKRNNPRRTPGHNTIRYEMINYDHVRDDYRELANNIIVSSINWYNSQHINNQNLEQLLVIPYEEKIKPS